VVAPAVPEGHSRIRTSVMASHTDALIDEALQRIERAGKQVGLI
jgi:7-keto-8-aminopelargonate synthetase-like enzyme